MKNGNALVIRVLGKNMELSVYEDRVELFKAMWSTAYVAQYANIHRLQFRQPAYEKTGFIKIKGSGAPLDFVTYKSRRRDTTEQIESVQNEMHKALNEIESRVKAARGLPDNAWLTQYF